ncbi:MAG: Nif3-like dinuclear metal center hexameric protein [Caldimicrobium thiodismutans]
MSLKVKDFYQFLDSLAPLRIAEKKDSNGLQIGSFEAVVSGIVLAVNPSLSLFKEAVKRDYNLIITHHPLFYQPLYFLHWDEYPGNLISFAVENKLNLLSWHTPLDKVSFGVSEALARAFDFETEDFVLKEEEGFGYGKVVKLKNCVKLEALAKKVKETLKTWVMLVGDPDKEVEKIAICGGAGGFLKEYLKGKGINTLITSDVKYHQAFSALEEGFNFILIDHGISEFFVLRVLKEKIENFLAEKKVNLGIYLHKEESPYKII